MSALRSYQRRMAAVVAGGDPAGLAQAGADPALAWRAAVYRNTFAAGCSEALAGHYPAVAALVGAEFFQALARAYIAAHPPKARSLVGYGQEMPQFLRRFPPVAGLPYLPAAAELDRAWMAAHVAADAMPLSGTQATRMAAAEGGLAAAAPALHPSVRLVATAWKVYPLWAALRAGATPEPDTLQLVPDRETVLVWRPGFEVRHRSLGPGEAAFLARVQEGAPLGAAGAAATAAEPAADLARLFAGLLDGGVFAAPSAEGGAT
jgi:hypothetical protein